MIRLVPILFLLLVAGCESGPTNPSGPYRALNAGRWTPTEEDLRGPRTPLPPSSSPALSPARSGA